YKTHTALAFALFESDPGHANIDRVIEENDKALRISDNVPATLLNAGSFYRIKGDSLAAPALRGVWYRKSIDVLHRAAKLDQPSPDLYYDLGTDHLRLGQHQKAIYAFTRLRQLAPTDADAYEQLAAAQLAAAQPEP